MTTNRLLKSALVNTLARLISVSAVMMGGFASARAAYADAIIIHDRFNGSGDLTARHPDTNVPNSAWSVTGSGASVWTG